MPKLAKQGFETAAELLAKENVGSYIAISNDAGEVLLIAQICRNGQLRKHYRVVIINPAFELLRHHLTANGGKLSQFLSNFARKISKNTLKKFKAEFVANAIANSEE